MREIKKTELWLKSHYRVRSFGFEFQSQHLLKYVHGQIALLNFSVPQFPSFRTEYNRNSILNLYICEESKVITHGNGT